MTVRCNSCGSTYEPVQRDGTLYFHACAPLSAPELTAKVAAGRVVLPAGETVEIAVSLRTYERANKRDENIVPSRDPKLPVRIKAEGDGTTPIPDPPAQERPVVVVPN